MKIYQLFPILILVIGLISCQQGNRVDRELVQKPNILFIAIDDLRPELGCYGNKIVKSPHIDKLAAQGSIFKNHYVVVPTCGASRFSLITGMLPRSNAHIRKCHS